MASEPKVPDDFSALYDLGLRTQRGLAPARRTAGDARLSAAVDDLHVEYDEATRLPVRVTRRSSARGLAAGRAGSPDEAARGFIQEHGDLWNLSDADMPSVQVKSVSARGLPTVRLIQQVEGKDVFHSDMTVALNGANEVVSVTGQLFAGATTPPARGRAGRAPTPIEEAIATAARDLTSHQYEGSEFSSSLRAPEGDGADQYYTFTPAAHLPTERPAFDRDVRTKTVMFPLGEEQFAAGVLHRAVDPRLSRRSATSSTPSTRPDILFRKNLTSPAPSRIASTTPATRSSVRTMARRPARRIRPACLTASRRATVREKLITIESLLPGDPWLPAGAQDDRRQQLHRLRRPRQRPTVRRAT